MSLFRTQKNCLMSAFRISYFPHNYPLANNMPLSRNNMPLSGNKDGLLTMQKSVWFFCEKNGGNVWWFRIFFVTL